MKKKQYMLKIGKFLCLFRLLSKFRHNSKFLMVGGCNCAACVSECMRERGIYV